MNEDMPVRVEVQDSIMVITIDRPQVHNALDAQSRRLLTEAMMAAEDDSTVRVIALLGTGRSFSAGHDIREVEPGSPVDSMLRELDEFVHVRVAQCTKPTIAGIHGHTIGRGLMLALACDIRVAADNLKASLPEVRLGMFPALGGSHLVTRVIGQARALHMVLTAESVDAQKALDWGMVTEVVGRESLEQRVLELARRLASHAPLGMRFAKSAIERAYRDDLRSGALQEIAMSTMLAGTADWTEGRSAAADRRVPGFEGR